MVGIPQVVSKLCLPCQVYNAKRPQLAPWLNWIEQPPPKGQVIGSNPIGVTIVDIYLRGSFRSA